jgi:hypothetical protein
VHSIFIPKGFLKEFSKSFHNKKAGHWKKPFSPLFTEEDLFLGLIKQSEKFLKGEPNILTFQSGKQNEHVTDPDLLPRKSDRTLKKYYERINKSLNRESVYLALHTFESASPEIWLKARNFGALISKATGSIPHAMNVGSFISDAEYSPFGVHTDKGSIFTSILQGNKKIRVWPRNALGKEFANPPRRARPGLIKYDQYLPTSQLLEGNRGDIFYWPDTFWHIGEGSGELTVTIVIGIDFRPDPIEVFKKTFRGLISNTQEANPPANGYHWNKYKKLPDEFEGLVELLEDQCMALKSTFGLQCAIPKRTLIKISPNTKLQIDKLGPILYIQRDEEIVVFANGHQITLNPDEGLVKLIKTFNSGKTLTISQMKKIYPSSKELQKLIKFLFCSSSIFKT